MQLAAVEVEVRDGFVVAASDGRGHKWASGRRTPLPRLLSHVVLMGAIVGPFMVTAASAHPASPSRVAERGYVAAAEPFPVRERQPRHSDADVTPVVAVAAVATPAPAPARPFASVAPAPGGNGHFSFGWCTYYVSTKRYVPWTGNAIDWWPNAAAMGFPEGQAPKVGAIMVTRESGWGHVAYVEAVDPDGNGWTVSEMNFKGFGVISTRHIRMGQVPLVGFIY